MFGARSPTWLRFLLQNISHRSCVAFANPEQMFQITQGTKNGPGSQNLTLQLPAACSKGAVCHLQSLAGMPFLQFFFSSEDNHSNVEGCSHHLARAAVPPAGSELSCISQCMSTAETIVLSPCFSFPCPCRVWEGSVAEP